MRAAVVTPGQWLGDLLDHLGAGRVGNLRQCPAHHDGTPSLSIRDMPDGMAALKCFRGCTTAEVLAALHLSRRALVRPMLSTPASFASFARLTITFPPVEHPRRLGHAGNGWHYEAAHDYGDRWRLVRYRHTSGRKDLAWETRDDHGAWVPGLRGTTTADLPLYAEREALAAVALGEVVHVVESESSADALMARGLYATTWAGGASSPALDRLARVLAGAHVVLIPDNDEPGIRCAELIRSRLADVVETLATVQIGRAHV